MALRQESPDAEEQSDGEARGDGLPERPVPDRDEVEGRLPGESRHDAFFKGVGHIRAWMCPTPLKNARSEEHTSELQSQSNLVCRLLLEKKNNITPEKMLDILGP